MGTTDTADKLADDLVGCNDVAHRKATHNSDHDEQGGCGFCRTVHCDNRGGIRAPVEVQLSVDRHYFSWKFPRGTGNAERDENQKDSGKYHHDADINQGEGWTEVLHVFPEVELDPQTSSQEKRWDQPSRRYTADDSLRGHELGVSQWPLDRYQAIDSKTANTCRRCTDEEPKTVPHGAVKARFFVEFAKVHMWYGNYR